jgi:CRISPR-associated protein Csb3
MEYDIQVNPLNPVEYLACCGMFEIVARFDGIATSYWPTDVPPRFVIESLIAESDIVASIIKTCTNQDRWTPVEVGDTNNVIRVDVTFSCGGVDHTFKLDWWYETLTKETLIQSDLKESEKSEKNSAWKMYSGNQTVEGIIKNAKDRKGMVETCKQIAQPLSAPTLSSILSAYAGMTGRFAFDPRASRSALDVGYSPDALDLPVPTYPFAELLAAVAIQHFFPNRTRQASGLESTRGWSRKKRIALFNYGLWRESLPITLARVFASNALGDTEKAISLMQSRREERGRKPLVYYNLSISTPTALKR